MHKNRQKPNVERAAVSAWKQRGTAVPHRPAPIAFGDPIIGDTDTLNAAISACTNAAG